MIISASKYITSNASLCVFLRSYVKSQSKSVAERLTSMKLARDKLADASAVSCSNLDGKSKMDSS